MYVITGLGNPGDEYVGTRHNAGFIVIDMLSRAYGIPLKDIKYKAVIGEGVIGGQRVVLAKPQTYMNSSGLSVLDLVCGYKIEPSNLIVIYDDIDLKLGKVRIRPSGSAGTHNGMRSIVYQLQTEDFPRIRIGIGAPPPGQDLADYVLSPFKEEELPVFLAACERAVKGVELILTRGIQEAMSRCNG
ncbi:aminoacyl-tRNA hydrolase [Caldicoprobacter algeriensis]|uniref:aminoacyl-tRNA hydrolase n=1 Tax=Caldicoprobacter algeriensis TaxID=699281 RepID=UPI00207A5096|nr:aminoacyl-tRNA hydrolase [Caldicoprobacter algeriensis]